MDNGAGSYLRFLDGDDDGIVEIIRDYKDGLLLYINSFTGNISLSEELMEDVFFRIVTKKPKFSGKSSFKTWLYAIGRNAAADSLRRRKKISDTPYEEYGGIAAEEDIEREYIKKERRIMLHRIMRRLNHDYQQVLYLVYFEDFSNAEAAVIMNKSKRQIENLLYRAKNGLKTELEKEGFVYENL